MLVVSCLLGRAALECSEHKSAVCVCVCLVSKFRKSLHTFLLMLMRAAINTAFCQRLENRKYMWTKLPLSPPSHPSHPHTGTRETAVLNAYFSIGAISALARACREQRLLNCPCATDSSILFSNSSLSIFASCSDNLDWAIDFARDFIVTSQLQVASSPSLSDLVGEHNVDLGKDVSVCVCECVSVWRGNIIMRVQWWCVPLCVP